MAVLGHALSQAHISKARLRLLMEIKRLGMAGFIGQARDTVARGHRVHRVQKQATIIWVLAQA